MTASFPETCLSVYMADEHQPARFITVNIILHYLFLSYGTLVQGKCEEYLEYSRSCGTNVETALANLPLHLPANEEMIAALSLGVLQAVGSRIRVSG